MNLFVLSPDPIQSAKWLCNKHCIKMILETAQMLCSVFHLQDISAPYKLTHKNHPTVVWCRQSIENFEWALTHGFAICDEYTERYGKVHKSRSVLNWCWINRHELNFPQKTLTPFAQAMPDIYKDVNPVTAYQNYYKFDKKHLHDWKQNKPDWI